VGYEPVTLVTSGASGRRERFPRWRWDFGCSASEWGERDEGRTSKPVGRGARHVRGVGRLRSRGVPNRSLAGRTEVEGAHEPGKGEKAGEV
jgi:hypothetical protein